MKITPRPHTPCLNSRTLSPNSLPVPSQIPHVWASTNPSQPSPICHCHLSHMRCVSTVTCHVERRVSGSVTLSRRYRGASPQPLGRQKRCTPDSRKASSHELERFYWRGYSSTNDGSLKVAKHSRIKWHQWRKDGPLSCVLIYRYTQIQKQRCFKNVYHVFIPSGNKSQSLGLVRPQ